ncbi:MAG: hypothetical protein NTV29_04420 [Planctomycetota bacterium]|jgi:hypothetical protein|nr:hypothetical protein [Planctomycetota bacterium]
MSDVAAATYFFLTVRSDASSPPSVFYYADDEWMAIELCKLFKSEFGQFCDHEFSHMVVSGDDTTQLVRLRTAVDEVSLYQDPDPGIYDPEPTQELLQLANYYSRATQWESLLESLRKQEPKESRTNGPKQGAATATGELEIQSLERVRSLLEKHRLMFLYFAVPKQINPLATGNKWQLDSLKPDQFPKFKSDEIDDDGEFLFTYRRRLEQFVQTCYSKFGSGAGSKPRVLTEDCTIVDVEGGSLPAWYLDDGACVYLDESAEQILASMRDAVRKGQSRLLQPFIKAIKDALHDQGKSKWYASEPVRWEYVSRLDSILHELRTFELEQPSMNKAATAEEVKDPTLDDAAGSPDVSAEDLLKGIPEEDDRNSGLILLMLFAQAYYKMLEATTSLSDWLTAMDLGLNHSYIWTVQNLTNLLKNNKHLSDFPEKFEPMFDDLYPTTITDVDWQWMVAPHADGFLATVQRYVLKKGTYDPEEGSPAWIMVQLFRPGVETAIERAENYNRRLRKAQKAMFGETTSTKPHDAAVKADSDVAKAEESQQTTTNVNTQIAIPPGAKWSEVAIRFLDAHNVQVTFREQSQRFHFTQMNMADGRSNLKPTKQWDLLYSFARDNGVINWGSKSASPKLKKQKQELSEKLSSLFAIVGEPIVYLDEVKGWKTVFQIMDS